MRVAVVGGGGQLAEAVSAWLDDRPGVDTVHFRPKRIHLPGVPRRPDRPRHRFSSYDVSPEVLAQQSGGRRRYRWRGAEELRDVDAFVYCLPSYLAETTGLLLAGSLSGKAIINLSDRFMGTEALIRAALFRNPGLVVGPAIALNSPPALAYQRRRDEHTSLIYSKPFVLASPVGETDHRLGNELLQTLFGITEVRWFDKNLELSFENINSIVHAVQDLACLKAGRFDDAAIDHSLYSHENYTQEMVHRIESVVEERDRIASHFTVKRYRSLEQFDSTTFQTTSSDARPGTALYRQLHPLLSTVPRPTRFSAHGYEDIGWAMVPLEDCARIADVQTPFLTGLIDEWNSFVGSDYRRWGRSASSVGVTSRDLLRRRRA